MVNIQLWECFAPLWITLLLRILRPHHDRFSFKCLKGNENAMSCKELGFQ
jgi:hypothetical protein